MLPPYGPGVLNGALCGPLLRRHGVNVLTHDGRLVLARKSASHTTKGWYTGHYSYFTTRFGAVTSWLVIKRLGGGLDHGLVVLGA